MFWNVARPRRAVGGYSHRRWHSPGRACGQGPRIHGVVSKIMLIPPQSGINKFVSKMSRKNIDSAAEGLTLFFWIRTFLDTLILWIRFGYVLDTLWIRFGYGGPNLDTLWIRVFWIRFGYVLDTLWIRFGYGQFWIRFGYALNRFHWFFIDLHLFCKGCPLQFHRILMDLHLFCKGYPLEFH